MLLYYEICPEMHEVTLYLRAFSDVSVYYNVTYKKM